MTFVKLLDELNVFFRDLPANNGLSVLVGVSGGADSVALLHILYEYKERLGIKRLGVAHVNHGLRGEESDGDEVFVRGIAEKLQIEFFHTKLCRSQPRRGGNLPPDAHADAEDTGNDTHTGNNSTPNADNAGIENWARQERYNFFHKTARECGFDYIATAHTANDQAETLLMRLARGTGVRGLRGILPVRGDGVIRPLLGVERRELEEWLESRGFAYRTDSTNADVKYRRNFVRSRIIPLLLEGNPGAISNIAACACSAARAWDIVENRVNEWIDAHITKVSRNAFHADKIGLRDERLAPEALLILFEEYGISASRLHIDRVMKSVILSAGEHLLPDGWRFYPRKDRVCFVKVKT